MNNSVHNDRYLTDISCKGTHMKNSLHRYSREKNNYIHKQQTNYFIDVEKTILLRSVSNGNIFVCIP